jgi:site-specific recombinase XerD
MKKHSLMESAEFSIYFHLRRTFTYENGEHPIVMRVNYHKTRKDIVTGLSCLDDYWISEKNMVDPVNDEAIAINEELVLIKEKSKERYRELKESKKPFSVDELIDCIKGKEPAPQSVMEYMDIKIKELEESIDIDMRGTTFYKYKRVKRYLEEFLLNSRNFKNYPVSGIDVDFINKFSNFLRKEKQNGQNSVTSLLSVLRTVLKIAIESGVIQKNPFDSIHFKRKPVNREYLSIEELGQMEKVSGLKPDLELARDLFLFACYTGLAYSDIKELKKGHINIDHDGSKFIHKARYKTEIMSLIPVLPTAEKILLKYSIDADFRNFRWKVPYNSKLNGKLKEVALLANIDKKIFMHLGRHTFATTITLSNGISLETVSKMLGHSTIKHTQEYAKITGSKVKNEMSKIMGIYS